jgi:peptidylprolyl isomerase
MTSKESTLTSDQWRRRAAVLVAGALLLAVAAGCGGDRSGSSGGRCEVQVGTEPDAKPSVTIPDCATKPAGLVTRDVIVGTGREAAVGDTVSVQYVGLAWSTKKQFDASWDRGAQPFDVTPLGRAEVISGWNKGLVGVRAGGRRLLVIPPGLGYGIRGVGSDIKPNETLVFVIDVVSVA